MNSYIINRESMSLKNWGHYLDYHTYFITPFFKGFIVNKFFPNNTHSFSNRCI